MSASENTTKRELERDRLFKEVYNDYKPLSFKDVAEEVGVTTPQQMKDEMLFKTMQFVATKLAETDTDEVKELCRYEVLWWKAAWHEQNK